MKKHILFILLALLAITAQAQAPAGYYNSANGKTGTELRQALHDIIKGHTTINYNNIWNAFWSTDNKGNGVVWDMYSDIPNGAPPYTYQMGQNQCGEYDSEGDCYNREHSFPQSWFGDQDCPAKTDLHHIFPTDGYVNSQRGNFPYGEVGSGATTFQNGSKLGTCKSSLNYNGTVFEPIDEYKGDFARAIMYMSVRYYGEDSSWGTSGMTDKSDIKPWAVTMLLRWNEEDPVSQKEIDRNNVIYTDYQDNRNPFIDNPEYARMIWDPNWTPSTPAGGDYVKVTSTDNLEDGDYLIVCESNNVAFNGALTTLDATGNTIAINISNNTIAQSEATNAAKFTITAKTGGYSIKSASGYYIGNTSNSNDLKTSQNDSYVNTISIIDGNADIVSSSSHLRYNANSDQARFRYFKSSTYTSQQAIQLYKKATTYSITLATVEHGSITANAEEASAGSIITLTATPDEGYEFDSWTVTTVGNDHISVTNDQFVMPASNVTVSATFVSVGTPFAQHYYLVTSTQQLEAGRTYLIVNTAANKALGSNQRTNNREAASIIASDGIIESIDGTVSELTLGGTSGAWTFYDATNNSGYLYAASSTKNLLKTQPNNDANGQWAIGINSSGVATITAQGSNTNNIIRYNPNNDDPIFSCYASGQQDVYLFIRSEVDTITQNTTLTKLFAFDKHVITNGTTLTLTGTATCTDPSLLVIEDGGQLIHNSPGVQATVKRTIEAYTIGQSDGWYTIATPFTDATPSQAANGNFDLYAYNEAGPLEWTNYKAQPGTFAMASTAGFLYAHRPSTTLRMTGTLKSGNYSETVNLSYDNSNTSIKGYNLLGNPTAHDIVFNKTDNVSDGYYYLNNSEEWQYETSNSVPVGRGFLVKANAANQSVTLNPQSKDTRDEKGEYIVVDIDGDKAYVKINDGVSMPLLSFRGHHPSLWLEREGQPYIMMVRDGADIVELNYKAKEHGIHTLKVYSFHSQLYLPPVGEGLRRSTLHLIDRLTGADIDLLKNPSYQFESSSNDYTSRFQLVFNPNNAGDNDDFAFIDADGNLIVNGDGFLQVYDVLGHQLFSSDVHSSFRIPHSAFPTSVYILRLTTPEKTRIQKIIIN